ncbi:MAG: hypothetical protein WCP30_10560 [Mycobacteriaceae bacterium]
MELSEAGAFFQAARQAFDHAELLGSSQQRLTIAGEGLNLVLAAGHDVEAANRYLSALAARPAGEEGGQAGQNLTVLLWSAEGTGIDLPAPDWRSSDHTIRGELPRFSDGRFKTSYNMQSRALSAIDLQQGLALHCVRSFTDLPQYEWGAPLRDIIGWWLSGNSVQLIHASAVSAFGKGALLVGPGGSGKSTTAAQCLRHDALSFIADDYCAVSLRNEPRIHPLFRTSKLCVVATQSIPGLGAGEFSDGTGKVLFRLVSADIADDVPLRTILMPEIVDAERSEILPAGKGQAARRLMPSTLFQLPGSARMEMALMGDLIRRVPAFRLRLGRDRGNLLTTLTEHLKAL